MVITTDPEPGAAIVPEASVAVTPVGAPEIERATLELKEPPGVATVVKVPVAPGSKVKVAGVVVNVRVPAVVVPTVLVVLPLPSPQLAITTINESVPASATLSRRCLPPSQ
jgi:hypothetical protein